MNIEKPLLKKLYRGSLVIIFVVLYFWKPTMVGGIFNTLLMIVSPFIFAAVMAFIINVLMKVVEDKLISPIFLKKEKFKKFLRPCALLVTLLLILIMFIIIIFVIAPQLSRTIIAIGVQIEEFIPQLEVELALLFQNNPEIIAILNDLNFEAMFNFALDFLSVGAVNIFESTLGLASGFISLLTSVFIAFVFAIYILLQKEKLMVQSKKVLFAFVNKDKAKEVIRILSLSRKTFASFIAGQCLESVILGAMFVFILPIFQIPFSLLIGIIIGVTSIVPIVGAFLGAGIGTLLILIEDPMKAIYFLILFLIIQQIEGNLIYPRVVGNSIGLPAMWVLAAVSVGGSLFGVFGILFFIPLTSVAYTLFKETVNSRLKIKQIEEEELLG